MAEKVLDTLETGMKIHALYTDGEFYLAEVVAVSKVAKRSKAPVKVHFVGYGEEDDKWLPIDSLKSKKLPKVAAKAKAKAKAKAEKKIDYSGLEVGARVQAEAEGKYWAAEVLAVSEAPKKAKAPVKVRFIGYTSASDEWLGADRLRSKVIKGVAKGKPMKAALRFSLGDRVLCNLSSRFVPGKILQCDVEDPQDGEMLPYVVKTDNLPGIMESRTISAPSDEDMTFRREVCFRMGEWKLASDASHFDFEQDMNKDLRFAEDSEVAFRVHDTHAGHDLWVAGRVEKTWFDLQTGRAAPYLLRAKNGKTFYCHRDDHTLIRLRENVPQTRTKTIAKRFELRTRPDGLQEKFDHVTLRGWVVHEHADGSV